MARLSFLIAVIALATVSAFAPVMMVAKPKKVVAKKAAPAKKLAPSPFAKFTPGDNGAAKIAARKKTMATKSKTSSYTVSERKKGGVAVQGLFKKANAAKTGSDPFSFTKNKRIEAKRAADKNLAARTLNNSLDDRVRDFTLSGVILPGVFIPQLQKLSGKTFYEDNLTALEKKIPKVFVAGSAKVQKRD
jgi:hypothetical protein